MSFNVKYYASLESIFSNLSLPFTKGNLGPTSALAADIVGIGDSWLKFAIKKAVIEPIQDVDGQEWFKSLAEKWKVTLFCILFFSDLEIVAQDWFYSFIMKPFIFCILLSLICDSSSFMSMHV